MNATTVIFQVIFYVFGVSALFSALMVVTARNPVKGVLFLILTFIAMGGIWMLLQAEFLALILVVVYIGAVMTLFLFVVMMMNLELPKFQWKTSRPAYGMASVILSAMILAMLLWGLVRATGLNAYPLPAPAAADFSNVRALGMVLYSDDLYPFICAGVLLLVAMVAAITLAFRGAQARQVTSVRAQLAVDAAERLRMIKLKGEA